MIYKRHKISIVVQNFQSTLLALLYQVACWRRMADRRGMGHVSHATLNFHFNQIFYNYLRFVFNLTFTLAGFSDNEWFLIFTFNFLYSSLLSKVYNHKKQNPLFIQAHSRPTVLLSPSYSSSQGACTFTNFFLNQGKIHLQIPLEATNLPPHLRGTTPSLHLEGKLFIHLSFTLRPRQSTPLLSPWNIITKLKTLS